MKIIYLISSPNPPANGGHFYSLKAIAESMSESSDVVVFSLGRVHPPAIKNSKLKNFHLNYNGINSFKIVYAIKTMAIITERDVVHCFDSSSYLIGRMISLITGCGLVLTKCGGPNPKKYYPFSPYLIVFSSENYNFFANSTKYHKSKIYYLPNRVGSVLPDKVAIDRIKESIDPVSITLLRIARFTALHKESICQSIRLFKRLKLDGVNIQLVLIGEVHDSVFFSHILQQCVDGIYIFTEPEFTINASKLIELADIVVGSGRGIMEASHFSKVLLSPLEGGEYPALVDDKNVVSLLDMNFSARCKLANFNQDINYNNIKKICTDPQLMYQCKDFSRRLFDELFSFAKVKDDYISVYQMAIKNCNHKRNIVDYILNWLYVFRTFWKA